MRAHFETLSHYNLWANRTLYGVAAQLHATEIAQDRGGFFSSILGTLNHILVADRIWLARMTGQSMQWFQSLDQILEADFADLRGERELTDLRLIAVVPDLPLTGALDYVNTRGVPMRTPWSLVLAHVFNHQTHHRGQAHDMLSQAGIAPPQLDLLYFRS